jgi:hypothetical protein
MFSIKQRKQSAKHCLHANKKTSNGRVKTGMDRTQKLLYKHIMNCNDMKLHIPAAD